MIGWDASLIASLVIAVVAKLKMWQTLQTHRDIWHKNTMHWGGNDLLFGRSQTVSRYQPCWLR